ncbi:MAG: chemotaxis-specific protein-glutamate methyltransferase CheB [Magnetococcales bacterium]|nr:chemotaxis-specific protein-glutamate methyltransferase CheB [Magnetococcales bacterium]
MGQGPESQPLRVMVVDDTITYRMIVKKVSESIPGVQVVTSAPNGKLALEKLEAMRGAPGAGTGIEVVLLDVEMPVMDGLTTLRHLTRGFPDISVIMVSATSRTNANIIVECLNAGALDFVTKPLENNVELAKEALRRDLAPILTTVAEERRERAFPAPAATRPTGRAVPPGRAVTRPPVAPVAPLPGPPPGAAARVARSVTPPPPPPGEETPPAAAPSVAKGRTVSPGKGIAPKLVLIGSSTGGPAALTRVLAAITRRLAVPMLIVQHMPPVFTASLATQLARASGLVVTEAQDGTPVVPGEVILAQGGQHMILRQKDGLWQVALNDGPKVNECRPAVDVLFMSAAAVFPDPVLAVVLTGMGRDGAAGVDALKRAGKIAHCITQDKATCVVYGMPRAVQEGGLSDEDLPLARIGPRILEMCS